MNELTLIGDRELIRQFEHLQRLEAKTQNYKAIFARASKAIEDIARSNAKSFTRKIQRENLERKSRGKAIKGKRTFGPIWRAIKLQTSKRYRGVFWLGPERGRRARYDAYYAYWQEKGTRRGIRGKYFMRNAYLQKKEQTKKLITEELYKEIYKLAARRMAG